jgi:hypothetical protein
MKLLLAVLLAAIYLSLLWGPAIAVARKAGRHDTAFAYRCLRIILPLQVVSTVVLLVLAEMAGWHNPAGLMALATLGVSAGGAAAMALAGWMARFRK